MPKSDFTETICRPFCSFYRPGSKEELTCRGAEAAAELIRRKQWPPEIYSAGTENPSPIPGQDPALEAAVCAACPFKSEDCDFQSPVPPEDCQPCGGFILLHRLKTQGAVTLGDLLAMNNHDGL
jgi:hypothetical protein